MVNDLTVRILEARDLLAADRGGTSDPYAIVRVDNAKHKTKTVKKCLSPKWMETFRFSVANPKSSKVVIEVWDYDMLKKDDPLGCVTIPLSSLEKGVEKVEWYDLNGVPKGQIRVGLHSDSFGLTPKPRDQSDALQSPINQNYNSNSQYPSQYQPAAVGGGYPPQLPQFQSASQYPPQLPQFQSNIYPPQLPQFQSNLYPPQLPQFQTNVYNSSPQPQYQSVPQNNLYPPQLPQYSTDNSNNIQYVSFGAQPPNLYPSNNNNQQYAPPPQQYGSQMPNVMGGQYPANPGNNQMGGQGMTPMSPNQGQPMTPNQPYPMQSYQFTPQPQ